MIIDGTIIKKSIDKQSELLSMCICIMENPNCDIEIVEEFVSKINEYVTQYDMDCVNPSVCMMVSYLYHYVIFDKVDFLKGNIIDTFITSACLKEKEKITESCKGDLNHMDNSGMFEILIHHLIPRYKTKRQYSDGNTSMIKKKIDKFSKLLKNDRSDYM